MGYHTTFSGYFNLDHSLNKDQIAYLQKFSQIRHMCRNNDIIAFNHDPLRIKVGLPLGEEGEYYVSQIIGRDESIINMLQPPQTQPSCWCAWTCSDDGKQIIWNGYEKVEHYMEWLEYIINNFLIRWSYILNGQVSWKGEDTDDQGIIYVKNNEISFEWTTN